MTFTVTPEYQSAYAPPDATTPDDNRDDTTGGFPDLTPPGMDTQAGIASTADPTFTDTGRRAGTLDTTPDPYTQQQMIDAANGVNASLSSGPSPSEQAATAGAPGTYSGTSNGAGVPDSQFPQPGAQKGSPSELAATMGKPGFSVDGTTPNAPSLGISPPGMPSPAGASTGTGTGGPGQLSDQQWQADFQKEFGYYNPTYDSRANFLHEAQMGDTAIRGQGATPGADQLAGMAKYDSDARRVLDAVSPGGPGANLYNSDLGAQWATAHNNDLLKQIDQIAQSGGAKSPQGSAAIDWLKSQTANVPANPMRNADAFAVGTEIQKMLGMAGATNVQMVGTDIYYNDATGKPQEIYGGHKVSLADWVGKLQSLKDATATPAAAPAAATPTPQAPSYGGSPPRNTGFAAPRGNVGYTPSVAAAPPQANSYPPAANGLGLNPTQGAGFGGPNGNGITPAYLGGQAAATGIYPPNRVGQPS